MQAIGTATALGIPDLLAREAARRHFAGKGRAFCNGGGDCSD
jgi:hypothetical protein